MTKMFGTPQIWVIVSRCTPYRPQCWERTLRTPSTRISSNVAIRNSLPRGWPKCLASRMRLLVSLWTSHLRHELWWNHSLDCHNLSEARQLKGTDKKMGNTIAPGLSGSRDIADMSNSWHGSFTITGSPKTCRSAINYVMIQAFVPRHASHHTPAAEACDSREAGML